MKTPPLLLGAALLFWGWQSGLFLFSAIIILALEGSRLFSQRWNFSSSDFKRIWDISIIIFLIVVVYLFASNPSKYALLTTFQWLPLFFFPIIAAQVYSTSDKIGIDTFFLLFRKKGSKKGKDRLLTFNLAYPYFLISIISAGAANVRTIGFYAGLSILSAWALWFARSKRFSPFLWSGMLILVVFLGYGVQIGLQGLQKNLENKVVEWFAGESTDPYQSNTAIGDIGILKESGRIILRVKQNQGNEFQILLRKATYNLYNSSTWIAKGSQFKPMHPDSTGTTWPLNNKGASENIITVSARLYKGKGLLALPNNTIQISQLPVQEMKRNNLGAVRVEQGPGRINYRVSYSSSPFFDLPPNKFDFKIPGKEMSAITRIAKELKFASKSPHRILEAVTTFFQNKFKYSLALNNRAFWTRPIESFLIHSRSGHCEYFATATVLLLRKAGIPARYATGYSVQEFSQSENMFLVRERHAHAWTLVYIDGAWRNIDTTPFVWFESDAESASFWEPVGDLWSRGMFLFSQWRGGEKRGGFKKYFFWILMPLIFILVWKLYYRKRPTRLKIKEKENTVARYYSGADSDFYLIVKRLNESGLTRHPWEPLSCWIKRISDAGFPSSLVDSFQSILTLHYRNRFDPLGLSEMKKTALKSHVLSWLEQHKAERLRNGMELPLR